MPEDFERQLSSRIRAARIGAIAAFFVVAFPILAIACWKVSAVWGVVFAALFAAVAFLLWRLNRKKPRKEPAEPWCIDAKELEAVLCQGEKTQVESDIYVKQDLYANIRIRLLIQKETMFQGDAVSKRRQAANKNANRLLGSKQMVSMWEAMKMLRINLIICKEENKELCRWVQNTNRTLSRGESIVSMALVTSNNQLLIPALTGRFDLSELNRYRVAVEYIRDMAERKE